ncbi:MAG TPA: asparaginase [Solirubrobacteraceae bacterium]|nr:asparaginase [Solirubrobacteraceae bacterium]
MPADDALRALVRPVIVLGTGGTISMQGPRARPALDAEHLIESAPVLAAVPSLSAETVMALPSSHMSLGEALALSRQAAALAGEGNGVVIATGTDTLEELAALCALGYRGEAPIVLTGANRPASASGADGPANLVDAVAVAGSPRARGLGVCVCFGGELHAAMTVRKVDSTGPAAFGSPVAGPLGRVVEGRLWLHATPLPPPTIVPMGLDHAVEIVIATLGGDGAPLQRAARDADGVVLVAFGAGHLSTGLWRALCAAEVPVLITTRADRSSMLFDTYGFEGAEADLRSSGAVCVPFLSAPAARMALLCCLGAGLDRQAIADALSGFDAR